LDVSLTVWAVTVVAVLAVIGADLVAVSRRPHLPSMRESTLWVVFFIGLALTFGVLVWVHWGQQYASQFYAGWITEYSLSVDNLFVFAIIMSRFRVPVAAQQTVLLVGILLALLFRSVFIAMGAAAIARFSWVFYFFGAFLVYTAWTLIRHGEDDESDFKENALLRLVRRVVPSTPNYDGVRLRTKVDGVRLFTPMLVVMVAIGSTDVLFALDSIPAIFGLTKEPYLVFAANAFALMGLMQLYFLLGGMLQRLVYLSIGLAVILGFIGVKLVLEALHTNEVSFINGGEPVPWAPEIPILVSLLVIAGVLAVTTVASVIKIRQGDDESVRSGDSGGGEGGSD
jgi:tellurite resistance protein TerC